MDKLEKIKKFVSEGREHVTSRISNSKPEDCAVDFGALYILEKLNRILEEDDGGDDQH